MEERGRMGTETGKKNTRRKETHRRRGDEATHGWNSGASLHRTDSKKKKKNNRKTNGTFYAFNSQSVWTLRRALGSFF